jgi:hypothetical protein
VGSTPLRWVATPLLSRKVDASLWRGDDGGATWKGGGVAMRFELVLPPDDDEVDSRDELNDGYSRKRALDLLDTLRAERRWPYELLVNWPVEDRRRLLREATAHQHISLRGVYERDGDLRLGTSVPALFSYDANGRLLGVYPNRDPATGAPRRLVQYLEDLEHAAASGILR